MGIAFAPKQNFAHDGAMNELDWHEAAEQMATGLALVDADMRVSWINPSLAECLQLGPRSALGQPLVALLREPETVARISRAMAEQRALQWRGLTLHPLRGDPISADVELQPLGDKWLLEVHVLTESPAIDSPLSATLRGFAHEVKNPLAGLRGAAQLLQRRLDNADLQMLAGLIIDEADRLGTLANRLLHHDGAPQLGPVNIHQLLEWLTDLLRAESAPPQLRHDYDPSVPDLHGDAGRLQQVLLNLARNAMEAGAQMITLRTRIEHGVRLGERVLRMVLRLDVIDDGVGVPAALSDSLFQPLVSGRADGTGLGLALSREIAHEHGGELRCMSRPGETVFSLYLPLERLHD
jgi:two-component system nitrogen regulation sensor histidine kinase GlnL